jgi:hypothetical protein
MKSEDEFIKISDYEPATAAAQKNIFTMLSF